QTLVLTPLAPLAASTRYQVTLRDPLRARTGGFEFAFVNRELQISGVPGTDLARLPPAPELALQFNQPVIAVQVAEHCAIQPAGGGDAIALDLRDPGAVAERIRVAPSKALDQGQLYTLVCDGLTGAGGNIGLAEPWVAELRTYPGFAVAGVSPTGWDVPADEADIEITFSNPVNLDQVRRAISIKPLVAGFDLGALDQSGTRYKVVADLQPEKQYQVRVARGLRDVYGQALAADSTSEFRAGDARPRLTVETGIFAVEPTSDGYPVWTRNLSEFNLQCAAIPRDQVVKVLTSGMDYDPWYDAEDTQIDWKAMGLTERRLVRSIANPKNKWQLTNLDLQTMCGGKSKKGLYLAALDSDRMQKDEDHPWRYHPDRRVLANVTDLGLLLKAGTASGLMWVTSLSTARPVAGADVRIYTPQGKLAFSGRTGGDGLVRLPGTTQLLARPNHDDADDEEEDWEEEREQRLIAVVEHDGDMGVIDGNWANGIQVWNFGVDSDHQTGLTRVRGFIQSDRGIYRPGETVHFKGISREIAVGKSPRVPAGGKVKVEIESSRGSNLYSQELALTRFGGFAFDLELPAEADLGDYYVRATIGGQTFHEAFQVEEFKKVTYEVKLKPARAGETARLGDALAFDIKADYLFGAPVTGAQVEWNLQRRPHDVSFAGWEDYTFADWAARGWEYWEGRWGGGGLDYISDGKGTTNADGTLRVDVRDPQSNFDGPQDYLLWAQVTDASGEVTSRQTAVTAHRSDVYLGLHTQEYVQAVGMPFAVNAVAMSPEGKRVASKALLSLIRQDYQCTWDTSGYRQYQHCTTVHKPMWSKEIDIAAAGTATEKIMPKHPGEYVIRLETTDAHGNKVMASDWVWILGKGEAFWSGDESARMAVIASKSLYQPGETAKLVPRTDLENATALVTLERNGVLDAFTVHLAGAGEGVSVHLGEEHAPNVFASIAMVTGRTGAGDRNRPQFKMGVVDLKVASEHKRLEVRVHTDKPTYEPGEKVTGTITVTSAGQPVAAELSLSVADEGVLQLIDYKTPDPMAAFYAPWGLGMDNATNWNRIARLNDPTVIDPDEGGDSGDGGEQKVRSKFVSSAYWAPALVTDASGKVEFSFTAPDNLTAFRLMAVAADDATRFGSGDVRMTVKKPLLAQPVLPRFLTADDDAEVGITVHNYTGAAGTATVTARAVGATLRESQATVALARDGNARVRFHARAADAESARFTFAVTMGKFDDAVAVAVPIGRGRFIDNQTLAQ
ncbi:MAG TPA: MG2 domain-containing protein, partial [Kofleriaceae bacterium]|nr:MG2 domain-containing protein [Kofleriaceae bacterium]